MQRVIKWVMSALPLLIIAGLLYAAFFIKPQPVGGSVVAPVIERGDKFYGQATASNGAIWSVGGSGKILRSDDSGKSWALQTKPNALALQGVAAWDAERVVAVGDDGVVVATQDGGKLWSNAKAPRSQISNKLIRVKALSGGSGWSVGEGGAVLQTTDFGMNWVQVGVPEDVAWNDIAIHQNRMIIVGEFGRIKISGDAGVTWNEVESPVKFSLIAVAFKDTSNAVAVGLNGTVLRSGDAGATWATEKPVTKEHLFDVLWDGQRWVAVGDKGVLVTGDATGLTWKATRLEETGRGWYTNIMQRGSQYFFAGSSLVSVESSKL